MKMTVMIIDNDVHFNNDNYVDGIMMMVHDDDYDDGGGMRMMIMVLL